MNSTKNYLTLAKKKALEDELQYLKSTKRKENIAKLAYAKSLGDLSENAEYHQAREDQSELESQIKRIEAILNSAEIILSPKGSTVAIGSGIILTKEKEKEEKTFYLVGSAEADMGQGKISNNSPLGKALLGKKKNDIISFQTPNGEVKYKIIKIF